MGTTASSLQILGAAEDAVKAAMPGAAVGKWSERFLTACPGELCFGQLERKAGWLSGKLDCTVLSVSLFDGDDLSLALYISGKRMARHMVYTQAEGRVLGNADAFCAGLGLPPRLAPLLKRLFAEPDQEEKLQILSALLGTPLFVRWDDDFTAVEFQAADEGPLRVWAEAHPLPPKLKNQTRVELVQEIRARSVVCESSVLILRPLEYADEAAAEIFGCAAGAVIGHRCGGGEWARWDSDGRLRLTPLTEDGPDCLSYAEAGGRLLTFAAQMTEETRCGWPRGYMPGPTRVVFDSAGLLPLPLPLASGETPMTLSRGYLLPNGGFLAAMRPVDEGNRYALNCYSAEGGLLWQRKEELRCAAPVDDRVYVSVRSADGWMLRCLALTGQLLYAAAAPPGKTLLVSGAYLYLLEWGGYGADRSTLHRFTRDLQAAGSLPVPWNSHIGISTDGSFLVCAGYGSGLMVIGLERFELRRELRNRGNYSLTAVDGKNRIWAANGGYFECWSPDLEPLSRHRFAGDIAGYTRNQAGEICLATHQRNQYLTRVYRFYGKKP